MPSCCYMITYAVLPKKTDKINKEIYVVLVNNRKTYENRIQFFYNAIKTLLAVVDINQCCLESLASEHRSHVADPEIAVFMGGCKDN